MTSVERVHQSSLIEYEQPSTLPTDPEVETWPTELDLILKGVNLRISSQMKVGICGRTGAGSCTCLLYEVNVFVQRESHL